MGKNLVILGIEKKKENEKSEKNCRKCELKKKNQEIRKNLGKMKNMKKLKKIDLQAHLLHPPKVVLTRPTFHH